MSIRRMVEIGVFSVILVLIVSVSCVMSRICPSGYDISTPRPDETSGGGTINKLESGGIGINTNSIKTDVKSKEVLNKETRTKGNTSDINTLTPTTTEGTTSTTNKAPVSVVLYSANNQYGRTAVLTFVKKECRNLPVLMQNRVNSINTHGECVILCDNLDCGGWCLEFAPGTPAHHRFRKLRFHNRAESAMPCD